MIELDTLQGTEVYRVERTWVVDPDDVSVLDPTPTRALTLVTCYPFYFVGSAPQRFIVRAVPSAAHRASSVPPRRAPWNCEEGDEIMSRAMIRVALAAAVVCRRPSLAGAADVDVDADQELRGARGGRQQLVVRLPEGTRELTVPDDFRFIVDGQPLSVRELKAGMKGTATITTRTTVTPVTSPR